MTNVTNMLRARRALSDRIVLMGLAAAIAFWVLDGVLDVYVFGSGSLLETYLQPSGYELWVRVFVGAVLIGFSVVVSATLERRRRAERALDLERHKIKTVYENSPDGVLHFDTDYRILYANKRADEVLGMSIAESLGQRCYAALFARTEPCEDCPMGKVVKTGAPSGRVKYEITPTGRENWLHQLWYPVLDLDGRVESVIEIARDISELKNAEETIRVARDELETRVEDRTRELVESNTLLEMEVAERMRTEELLRDSEERYRRLVEMSPDMIVVHAQGRIEYINTPGARFLGAESPDEIVGRPLLEFVHADYHQSVLERMRRIGELREKLPPIEAKMVRIDGVTIDAELSGMPLMYEDKPAIQGVVRDITERKQAEATIKRMAYYDPLSDLPNRSLFVDRLTMALAHAHRKSEPVAVMFLDIDNFKTINDTLGHDIGDRLLRGVGERLATIIREGDTVARIGGDEFTLLLPEIATGRDARLVAQKVLETLRPPFEFDGQELHATASIGIAIFPGDGTDPTALLKNADTAMYRAKEAGRNNFQMYSPVMNAASLDRLALENDLRHALERDEFVLHYQPQVDMSTGGICGMEALLRWRHPVRGLVSPLTFIGLAEDTGLIVPIGEWVLRTACAQSKAWREAGLTGARVAVNLSGRQFLRRNVIASVHRVLKETGLPAQALELEITESIAMNNVEYLIETLGELRQMGVRIAIDDFGTGYSSLSYLQRFPIHTLKIAQTFVRDVGVSADSAAIASAVLVLGQSLGLDVIAEGVETEQQLSFLRERGCDLMQGNLLSPPLTADGMTQLLREGRSLVV